MKEFRNITAHTYAVQFEKNIIIKVNKGEQSRYFKKKKKNGCAGVQVVEKIHILGDPDATFPI